jgi:hypothetical protein
MALSVSSLITVSKIDEGHRVAFAAKVKFKQATVKRQSCVDVTDLDSNVIETDSARFCCCSHSVLHFL